MKKSKDTGFRYYFKKAMTLPAKEIPGWLFVGMCERSCRFFYSFQRLILPFMAKLKCLKELQKTYSNKDMMIASIKDNIKSSYFISWEDRDKFVNDYKETYGEEAVKHIVEDSNELCNHIFDLLGSGKTALGHKIDWRTDFASGRKWPLYPYNTVPIEYEDKSDIIRVWELSRFQWGVTLGQAYWFTGNSEYVAELESQIMHWIKLNPYGFGPNWVSSQDVALRAIGWIDSLSFAGNSDVLSRKFWLKIIYSLFLHAEHIFNNLSIRYKEGINTSSNHYLSELLGLLCLGLLFRKVNKGELWLRYAIDNLEKELLYQVHQDGADYESSISYHKFVLDHFITMYLLHLQNNIPCSDEARARLEKMFEFVFYYNRKDGYAPQIGDTSDGRAHIFSNFGKWKKNDHRYLLSIGSNMFGRNDFFRAAGKVFPEAFWLCKRLMADKILPLKKSSDNLNSEQSSCFSDAGFYFMRTNSHYMMISANQVGTNGKGNHKHNDIFSFEVCINSQPFIIDPGSYVYTTSKKDRNLFRSTNYHNTIMIDGEEINPFDPDNLFEIEERAYPSVDDWESCENYDYFEGTHRGYLRLRNPVFHKRKIFFYKQRGIWIIQDIIYPADEIKTEQLPLTSPKNHICKIELFFHFESLIVEQSNEPIFITGLHQVKIINEKIKISTCASKGLSTFKICSGGPCNLILQFLSVPDGAKYDISEAWISKRYGMRKRAPMLTLGVHSSVPATFTYLIGKYEVN